MSLSLKHRTPLPRRKIDAPWAISQDISVRMDDASWLQALADGEIDFQMPPYPWQYIQNEVLYPIAWSDCGRNGYHINIFKVSHIPAFPGSVSATIYREDTAIQCFFIRESGAVEFTPIGKPEIFVEYLNFINLTGHLELKWNGRPGHNHVVISYEYEYSSSVETRGRDAET
jgi:hypothetical protein